jgi:hypothetical protein
MKIPSELAAYFEHCFIYGFGFCEGCGENVPFQSSHEQYSDESWLDESQTMKRLGWVVPEQQVAYCSICAQKENLKHDLNAHEIDTTKDF